MSRGKKRRHCLIDLLVMSMESKPTSASALFNLPLNSPTPSQDRSHGAIERQEEEILH